MKMKKVVPFVCAALLAANVVEGGKAALAGEYKVVPGSSQTYTPNPTSPINRNGRIYPSGGSATETASASGRNAYSSGTAGATGQQGGGASISASTRVHESWYWDTADPNADPAPLARVTSTTLTTAPYPLPPAPTPRGAPGLRPIFS